MKPFRWSHEKNELLKKHHGISFEEIVLAIKADGLLDIQARAMEEGIPYQTLIASVLHKYVSGRLMEKPSNLNTRTNRRGRVGDGA